MRIYRRAMLKATRRPRSQAAFLLECLLTCTEIRRPERSRTRHYLVVQVGHPTTPLRKLSDCGTAS
jgi:hypothetical protein